MRAAGAGERGRVSGSSGASGSDSCGKVARVRPTGVATWCSLRWAPALLQRPGLGAPSSVSAGTWTSLAFSQALLRGPGLPPGSGLGLLGARLAFVQVFVGPG